MTPEVGDPGDGLTSGSGSPIAQRRGVCEACGTPLATDRSGQYCPVCMLRRALGDASEAKLDIPGTTVELESAQYGFEHYKLVLNEDGTPLELGRGAMGVTFKATDINLKRLVALKVVNAQYLGNESARERFVSEARSAAGLHHPNVASVFHLGKTGDDYFYAMEFVEGETLDRVLKFRGPLDVDVALEIVNQVAAALSAAYRHNLVHRDIKPGNLMVVFGEANQVTVKVIDFGLAKPLHYRTSERARSEAGIFFGTPHFASPEQCLGKEADNRSDIYSLGVTLWAMLTGHVPFEGMVTEVMQKHVHEPPPVERLEHVPKPVVSLIEALLEKDPANRPQSPYQLQTMIREVRETLGADRRIDLVRDEKGLWLGRGRSKRRRRNLALIVGILVAITMTFFYSILQKAPPSIEAKSVAVLPFDNVGNDKENEYFSDGLTTEVIYQLSRVLDLRVISRGSVLRYKALPDVLRKPLREIGAELEVATILESSVQRLENRIKITTILYDARTNRRLWGESYDRQITDLFAIQSDVAQNIAAALQVRLSADERGDIQRKPTENLTAYDLYLRGMAVYELRHKKDNDKAIELFQEAIQKDAGFALGYAGLANAYIERASYGGATDMSYLDLAIDFCNKAIQLDRRQVRGYTVLARAYCYKGYDDLADKPTKQALELAPNDVEAIKRAAYLADKAGQFEEVYTLRRKCHDLDPNDPSNPYTLGQICAAVGEIDLAQKWMQLALVLEPDQERRLMMESERKIYLGDLDGARKGLKLLPLDLITYHHTVLELLVACSLRVGDWNTVVGLAEARSKEAPGNWDENLWAFSYLALAARNAGTETESRRLAQYLLASMPPPSPNERLSYWDRFYRAFAYRVLDRTEDAYKDLKKVFPPVLRDLPLMNRDPLIEVFASDAEFQAMMKAADQNNKKMGKRIRELEKEPA
jgi:serine/threonine protein kinase/Tfp pilus assembly protein PilF